MAMTRRLHMGCGETLQSHLPESFRKLVLASSTKQQTMNTKQTKTNRKGRFLK